MSFFPNIFFNFKARYCSSLSCAAKHAALGVVLSRNISSNTQPSICAVVFFLVLNCRNSRSPYIFLSGLSFVFCLVFFTRNVCLFSASCNVHCSGQRKRRLSGRDTDAWSLASSACSARCDNYSETPKLRTAR